MRWSVFLEHHDPVEHGDGVPDHVVDVLVDELAPHSGSVTIGPHSWSAQFDVEVDGTLADALAEGMRICEKAGTAAGLDHWPAVVAEVMPVAEQERRLEQPQLPGLVGAQEVGALLGVSRQRIHQLRQEGRLPEPLFSLAATPVWSAAGIEAFAERRDRSPGRRSSALTLPTPEARAAEHDADGPLEGARASPSRAVGRRVSHPPVPSGTSTAAPPSPSPALPAPPSMQPAPAASPASG